MQDQICTILKNEKLTSQIYRTRIEFRKLAGEASPGQFVNVRITTGITPLLRRPFSIHRLNPVEGWIELLYDAIGTGTRLLSKKQPGETLSVLGPLGNQFNTNISIDEAIIIAGGIGIAPFFCLAEEFNQKNIKTTLYYGARTGDEFCCLDEFKKLGVSTLIATDDGSAGHHGFVTALFETEVNRQNSDLTKKVIFACGPPAMLRVVQSLALKYGFRAQLSLEAMMGCGFGICVGCAVPVRNEKNQETEYKLVCKNGPIFSAEEVIIPD